LENTFAIKEEFSNNEATSWAIEELKCRGLKRLFKPVASTAYTCVVREFYRHLSIDCDQQKILFSSIDRREVEVTIADIAVVLKCSHEPPELDIPWLECPSMLTLEDIVSDMCEGQYTDDRRNATSKTKIPRNLLFMIWCYIGTCVPWDTRHRGRTCSLVPSTHSTEVSGAPFLRLFGDIFRNFVKKCIIGGLSTRRLGDCLSLFSSLTFCERKGSMALQRTGRSLRAHTLAPSSGVRVCPTCPELH
jgi:hypothetical protein